MPSIFHQIQVGIDQGRRKASAHRSARPNVVRRLPKKSSSSNGGTNVEKFDEPNTRRRGGKK